MDEATRLPVKTEKKAPVAALESLRREKSIASSTASVWASLSAER